MRLMDPDAITGVLEFLTPRLRRLLARYQIPAMEGEDLLQDALLATLSQWDQIENKEGWLLMTMRNLCSAYSRKRRCWARLVHTTDTETLQALADALTPPQARREVIRDLKRLLEEVSD